MEKVIIYVVAISLVSVILTSYDKAVSKVNGRRVPEKFLFLSAVLGGSFSMYITMQIIRHKTRHKRFMIGLPLIIAVQIVSVLIFYLKYL